MYPSTNADMSTTTSTTAPVALILGAGPNIGAATAKHFTSHGFRVALVARSLLDGIRPNGTLNISADLSLPKIIPEIFEKVKTILGVPSVVIYNGLQLSSSIYSTTHNQSIAKQITNSPIQPPEEQSCP